MNVQEATQAALTAVAAGDLDAAAQALAVRENALRAASREEQAAALSDGEVLSLRLAELKRNLAAEHARLAQWREGLAGYGASFGSRCVDLRV